MNRYPYMHSWPHSESGQKAKARIVQSACGGLKLRYDYRPCRLHWKGPKRPTMKRCKFRTTHTSVYWREDAWFDYLEVAANVNRFKCTMSEPIVTAAVKMVSRVNKEAGHTVYRPLADWSKW